MVYRSKFLAESYYLQAGVHVEPFQAWARDNGVDICWLDDGYNGMNKYFEVKTNKELFLLRWL